MNERFSADCVDAWRQIRSSIPLSLLCRTVAFVLAACLPHAKGDGAAPTQLQVIPTTQLFVPGQTALQFRVSLQDSSGERITSDPANPFMIRTTVCRPGATTCSKVDARVST